MRFPLLVWFTVAAMMVVVVVVASWQPPPIRLDVRKPLSAAAAADNNDGNSTAPGTRRQVLVACIGSTFNGTAWRDARVAAVAETWLRTYVLIDVPDDYESTHPQHLLQSLAGEAGLALGAQECWAEWNTEMSLHAAGVQTSGVDASLDRLDGRRPPGVALNGRYAFAASGEGVTIYIIDTGVKPHNDFAPSGRLQFLDNFAGDGIDTDCNGHGTHVASLAAGLTYGASKHAAIRDIKVFDCGGYATLFSTVLGVQRVFQDCAGHGTKRVVINMSFGGGASSIFNDAVALVLEGCQALAFASAGNAASSTCDVSPAGYEPVITVAASVAHTDARAYFSNWGTCVDIAAPGYQVRGAGIASMQQSVLKSGTSMSSPFAAGIGANNMELVGQQADGSVAEAAMFARATPNAVQLPDGRRVKLVYSGDDLGGAPPPGTGSLLLHVTIVLSFGHVFF